MTTSFITPGHADLIALTTLGVNAKTSTNPIGYFGTGFKYAVACALRANARVELWIGEEPYLFTTVPHESRGKAFDLVLLDGRPLGFTTDLGRDWKPWMAVRELITNTMDEGGQTFTSYRKPDALSTSIMIIGWSEFDQAYSRRHEFILSTDPIVTNRYVSIHAGPSSSIFYRGIKVGETEIPSNYTYNIQASIALTEDRTLASPWMAQALITSGIMHAAEQDPALITDIFTVSQHHAESQFNYTSLMSDCTEAGLDLIEEITKTPKGGRLLPTLLELHHSKRPIKLAKRRAASNVEAVMITVAINQAAAIGYTDLSAFPINVVNSIANGILGKAQNNEIYISSLAFTKGQRCVTGTLIEEYLHLTHGFSDESRGFQDYLIDRLAEYAAFRLQHQPNFEETTHAHIDQDDTGGLDHSSSLLR
jgi:hypothetical protein